MKQKEKSGHTGDPEAGKANKFGTDWRLKKSVTSADELSRRLEKALEEPVQKTENEQLIDVLTRSLGDSCTC